MLHSRLRGADILKLPMLLSAVFLMALPATAQLERLPLRGEGPAAVSNGSARFIQSGALLLASFDANGDFIVTDAEIEAGARATFKVADADGDGMLTPIEQRLWAARIAGEGDVLENSRFFRSAIPNQVTEAEFLAGIRTFSDTFRNETGEILFTSFIVNPQSRETKKDEMDDEIERLRRPKVKKPAGVR